MKFYQRILLLLLVTTVSGGPKKGKKGKMCPDLEVDLKKFWHAMRKQYGDHPPQPIYVSIPQSPPRTL